MCFGVGRIPLIQLCITAHICLKSSLAEGGSFIYSNEPWLQHNEAKRTVRIDHIAEMNNSLIGVVDETTYIKLAEFNQNADRPAIIATLNKRYKGQPVAIKKKIDLTHDCHHDIADVIKNAAFDKQATIDRNTSDLLESSRSVEDQMYNWYADEISAGNEKHTSHVS